MGHQNKTLPHWTWADLEAALDGFSPLGADDPVRAHLMRGLAADAERASPRELLQQVLSAGWVMAPGGGPERRLGYRPPPASWSLRLLILFVIVVVTAVMMKAVAELIIAYASLAGEIGDITAPSRS